MESSLNMKMKTLRKGTALRCYERRLNTVFMLLHQVHNNNAR